MAAKTLLFHVSGLLLNVLSLNELFLKPDVMTGSRKMREDRQECGPCFCKTCTTAVSKKSGRCVKH